jgi:hypothetical protein
MKANQWQVDCSQHVYERNSSIVLARTGTGKTLSYLMTLQDWLESRSIRRAIVTAPLRVCNTVWRQEAEKWDIPVRFALCTGEMSRARQEEAIQDRERQLLVNHTMLPKILNSNHGAQALLIDELSLFRRPGGAWQRAVRFCDIPIRTGGTGTPAPNGLTSIYGMTQAVGCNHVFKLPGGDFSRNHDKWQRRFFYPTDYQQYAWAPFKETPDELAQLIEPYTYTLEAGAVDLPPVVRPPIDVPLPPKLRRKYEEMRATSKLSDEEILADNAAIVRLKLRQIISGFAYNEIGDAIGLEDDYRLDVLEEIVDEQQGQPILIVYEFRAQLDLMRKRWPRLAWIGGGSTGDEQTITHWNAGRLPMLALHPYAAGHGLNLQEGGSAIVWWQIPDDLEAYMQTLARLVRRGQKAESVYSYEISALGTIDQAVRARAAEKSAAQDDLWAALRR